MEKKPKRTVFPLLDTRAQFKYEEYVEWCEDNELPVHEATSSEYFEWCYTQNQLNYIRDREWLADCKIGNRAFLVTGRLGLWWGKPEIVAKCSHGLLETIDKCIGRDIEDVTVLLDTQSGVIRVYGYHHDGTNTFELHLLNKNGEKWVESCEERGDEIKFNNRWWTKIANTEFMFV